jgi:hypothetical protein
VVLRKFTAVWKAAEQLDLAIPFYERLEQKLNTKFDEKFEIKRAFNSVQEQKNWFSASYNLVLKRFLNPAIENKKIASVIGDLGFGTVN